MLFVSRNYDFFVVCCLLKACNIHFILCAMSVLSLVILEGKFVILTILFRRIHNMITCAASICRKNLLETNMGGYIRRDKSGSDRTLNMINRFNKWQNKTKGETTKKKKQQ